MDEDKISEVIEKAVCSTFIKLGFDMSNPTSIQKDIAHLRKSRKRCETIGTRAVICAVTAVFGLLISLLAAGFFYILKQELGA